MQNYIIGVDGGGTKTHAVLIDKTKKIIDESFNGPANIRTDVNQAYISIKTSILQLIKKHNLSIKDTNIGIGVAGFSVTQNRHSLLKLLKPDFSNIRLDSDCHIACLAAHSGENGVIIICGTGIVAYYIDGSTIHQIGGWGFPHGDLGGAAWIGLELCRYTCKTIDNIVVSDMSIDLIFNHFNNDASKFKIWLLNAKPNDYADIAKLCIESKHENTILHKILNNGSSEMVSFTQAVVNSIPYLPIKLTGGLSQIYLPKIKKHFNQIEISDIPSAFGAYFMFNDN